MRVCLFSLQHMLRDLPFLTEVLREMVAGRSLLRSALRVVSVLEVRALFVADRSRNQRVENCRKILLRGLEAPQKILRRDLV